MEKAIKQYSPEECQRICELTHQYVHGMVYSVRGDHKLADAILDEYKLPQHKDKRLSLNEIYEHFLLHAQNKSSGGNAIRKVFGTNWWSEEYKVKWEKLRQFLGGFDPQSIKSFETRENLEIALLSEFETKDTNIHVKRYITTIFQLGNWFARFQNGEAVYAYFNEDGNDPERLYNRLQNLNVFFGMKALLRDALKEMGYDRFVKPDVHVNHISRWLGLIGEDKDDSETAITLVHLADHGEITPYQLDKFFFLIGSGAFYRGEDDDIAEFFQKRDSIARKLAFVDFVKERLGLPPLSQGNKVALLVNYPDVGLLRGQVGIIRDIQTNWFTKIDFFNDDGQVIENASTQIFYPSEFIVLKGKNSS